MKIGLICEGFSDQAVIHNIIKGALGISEQDIIPLRPDDQLDETDKGCYPEGYYGGWTLVKNECIEGNLIEEFLDFHCNAKIIIHIDSAESSEAGFDILMPDKRIIENYVSELYDLIRNKILEWLSEKNSANIIFAISIEEIDAWILTIYDDKKETGKYIDPKKELKVLLNRKFSEKDRKKLFAKGAYDQHLEISKPFLREKKLKDCINKNYSLNRFYLDLIGIIQT